MGALHRHDARIVAQRLCQLSASHVESIDAARAAPQQHVGEAAGRRAHVEADAAAHDRSPNASSARGELLAAARHERRALDELDEHRPGRPARRACDRAARAVARADADLAGQEQPRGTCRGQWRGRASTSRWSSRTRRGPGRRAQARARLDRAPRLRRARRPSSAERLAHLLGDAAARRCAGSAAGRSPTPWSTKWSARQADELAPGSRAATRRRAPHPPAPRARPSRSRRSRRSPRASRPASCRAPASRSVSRRAASRSAR